MSIQDDIFDLDDYFTGMDMADTWAHFRDWACACETYMDNLIQENKALRRLALNNLAGKDRPPLRQPNQGAKP